MAQPEKRRSIAADWMGLLTAEPSLWLGGILLSYLGGRLSEVSDFPIFWRVAFYLFATLLIVSLVRVGIRATRALRHRRSIAEDTGVPPTGVSFFSIAGLTDSRISVSDSLMTVGDGNPRVAVPVTPPGSVPSTPDELDRLAMELLRVSEALVPVVIKDVTRSSSEDWDQARAEDVQRKNEVRSEYAAMEHHVVYLYENARDRGFGDARLEKIYDNPWPGGLFPELVHRLGALGLRIKDAADKRRQEEASAGTD